MLPFTKPVGPIVVWNIKLNSIGSVKSLPVRGDFIWNSLKMAAISPLFIPSSLTQISSQRALTASSVFLSALIFSRWALIKWSSLKHSPLTYKMKILISFDLFQMSFDQMIKYETFTIDLQNENSYRETASRNAMGDICFCLVILAWFCLVTSPPS